MTVCFFRGQLSDDKLMDARLVVAGERDRDAIAIGELFAQPRLCNAIWGHFT